MAPYSEAMRAAAAGGRVTDLAGKDLRYAKPGFENPHFVASGPLH